jgi:hypothetical protein
MAEPVAWMDGQGNLYRYPDDADRGQTMRPLYLEQPTHPNLEEILNRAGFYRRREWEGLTDDFCYVDGTRQAERITIPPKREWVNLTDDEIKEIIGSWGDTPVKGYTRKLMDQIQDKLKEKNHENS